MTTRRSHQKSRHGCSTCKRRRVKCDEQRPICKNCSLRQEQCAYSDPVPFVFTGKSERRSRRDPNSATSPAEARSSSRSTVSSPSLSLDQLELQLQWIKHTHKLFARSEETRKVWEILVLEEALRNPFLMHGVLAISALHVSHLCRDGRQADWIDVAIAHKSTALSLFSDRLHCIDESNAKAMMSFASIAVVFSFASVLNSHSPSDGPSLGALTEVFILSRGVQAVVNEAAEFLQQSNFAPLFDISSPVGAVPDDVLVEFDRLQELNNQFTLTSAGHKQESYCRAITCLRELAAFTYAEPTSLTCVAGWAIRASTDFLDDLRECKPLALVLLAHYCVFLCMAKDNWCVGSWGRTVFDEIVQLLDPSWQHHIQWATNKIAEQ
ncbi:uncharacterized protein N7459_004681 [Penicillium hispanicum]|uniref:uncharacterized protein n=1 Tax=Penicillium hispanicum TaxID=1080232 RepID=UPI002541F915|nr:uncharacterized protein N7459_004681 [Penicillium hispanicum]KAJ5584881.1 hypothetical protein N7459_004681 [Penicillium hispanicum]